MDNTCSTCGAQFSIDEIDRDFYNRMTVSDPIDCPVCRRQRRLMFRNFFNLYHRTCDLSGKKIISMYDENVLFPVYEMHEWWSDKWDPLSYGKEANTHEPFFTQIKSLHHSVPRMSVVNAQCENTDYCTMSFASRNCYLVCGNVGNEDCAYGHILNQCKNCFDCVYCFNSELCYECSDCVQCYGISFSRDCDNCTSSAFLVHCTGCTDCFGCVGLHNKKYHIFNEVHSKEEYEKKISQLNVGDHRIIADIQARVASLIGEEIVKLYHGFNCENVTGDYFYNCKNIVDGYDLKNCEDCRHCGTLQGHRDAHDCNYALQATELSYNSLTSYGHNILCCQGCMAISSNITYCDNCFSCKDCFGCVGLKQHQYCILNKQYSENEYRMVRSQLVEHMRKTGEWGQFFPHALSPFAYNETMASLYFPLTTGEVLKRGWKWKEADAKEQQYLGPRYEVPDDIKDVSDDIMKHILTCEVTGRLYKIIPQELKFYRDMRIPVPRKCPDQRRTERMVLRNPRKLFDRTCAKCKKGIETTYALERPETVYCEECYLSTVY
ncbi:hypothetical protein A3C37_02740 [Candidatus Peribacteria bacterium RIFCSPHIGHO2_02_FULL_53_20]|nr:MAG: hypothetical protein A3C37_02740 [Candidatus Peribacteria bacterium RIFCSPHIGHO2_02_FULL_53_20]OGJ68115.1 MAG: hypothetical protein A3B61_02425 [Candidatus Peribacteria bacterium RIFCSPLOWO2_01_FULL_53_10]